MPYRAQSLGGLFNSGVFPDSRPRIDIGSALDAIAGTAMSLTQQAYQRRLTNDQLARQKRLDAEAETDRQHQRFLQGFRTGPMPQEDAGAGSGSLTASAYGAGGSTPSASGFSSVVPPTSSTPPSGSLPVVRVPDAAARPMPSGDATLSATSAAPRRIVGPTAAARAAVPASAAAASGSDTFGGYPNPWQGDPARVRTPRYVKVSDTEYFDPEATPEARREAAVTREIQLRDQLAGDRQRAARDQKAAADQAKVDARSSAYKAAGLSDEDAAAAAQSPALARAIFFPPTTVHAANRDYDNAHPTPRRVGGRAGGNPQTLEDRRAARITSLATALTKPTRGQYGTTTPGMSWDDALTEATRRVSAAEAAARAHIVESGAPDPAQSPDTPPASNDPGGNVDLSTPASAPTPAASAAPTAGAATAPQGSSSRRVRRVGSSTSSAPASSAPTASAGGSVAQRAYNLIATGQSTVESARQHLRDDAFAELQQLLKQKPIAGARPAGGPQ